MRRFHVLRFVGLILLIAAQLCHAQVQHRKFSSPNAYLIVTVLDDHILHCELSAIGPGPEPSQALYVSPMVLKEDGAYPGPTIFVDNGNTFETAALRIEVDPTTLAITVRDKTRGGALLTTLRGED